MKKFLVFSLFIVITIVGCSPSAGEPAVADTPESPAEPTQAEEGAPEATAAPEEAPPEGEPSQGEPQPFEAEQLPIQRTELFSGSGSCAICHTAMVDESGADVSNDRNWRSTMMANAARDPYWQAAVRAEIISNPDLQEIIEDKCATCHMSMARTEDAARGEVGVVFDPGYSDSEHELHAIAIDGVSCNTCHQIQPDNFGAEDSFSGGFLIDPHTPMGERASFGPYDVTKQLASVMQGASGFIPQQGLHIEESELCGTCHTLYTPYLDSADQVAGVFPEQTIYTEWLNSAFAESDSCQGCHMPEAEGAVQISITGGEPRAPFYQHLFVGGNAYLMNLFLHYGPEMAVTAGSEHFENTLANIEAQLQDRTAALTLDDLRLEDGQLLGTINIENQVGHKFPAGFPSRRAWLHIVVSDADGEVVFESGAVSPDGAIQGNDNDADPAAFEPHYTQITAPDQVQIYESIMVNTEGEVTTTLLRGAAYIKDNRLLPDGFDKGAVEADIAPYGAALQDADFAAAGDALELAIDLGGASGPFEVSVELLYQTIGFRWADNLRAFDAPEVARFLEYYAAVPNAPVVVQSVQLTVE